jgi:hypothetical protein
MSDADVRAALEALVPPFDATAADWSGALRLAGVRRRPRLRAAPLAGIAVAAAAALALSAPGRALVGVTFDHLSAWVGRHPGAAAPASEQRALQRANARAAAPVPADSELGLLANGTIEGERFDLYGFRDRESLCLQLRSSVAGGAPIVKAPADCVAAQLLADLKRPLAVVAAANPFPRRAGSGLQALYGLARDGVAAVELHDASGTQRVPVRNNAFLFLYRGEGPRLDPATNRLDYRSDVPESATALDGAGRELGTVPIASLKRGYAAAPTAASLPGPSSVARPLGRIEIGWLQRGEDRGEPFTLRGAESRALDFRLFQPNPQTSLRVLVASAARLGMAGQVDGACLASLWPLEARPTGFGCGPLDTSGQVVLRSAESEFDAQFPVYYGLVGDAVASLELFLANGARETIPVTDNVFAFQAPADEAAKLVAYDEQGRVVGLQVISE